MPISRNIVIGCAGTSRHFLLFRLPRHFLSSPEWPLEFEGGCRTPHGKTDQEDRTPRAKHKATPFPAKKAWSHKGKLRSPTWRVGRQEEGVHPVAVAGTQKPGKKPPNPGGLTLGQNVQFFLKDKMRSSEAWCLHPGLGKGTFTVKKSASPRGGGGPKNAVSTKAAVEGYQYFGNSSVQAAWSTIAAVCPRGLGEESHVIPVRRRGPIRCTPTAPGTPRRRRPGSPTSPGWGQAFSLALGDPRAGHFACHFT